jgi:hypothetical protein
MNEPEKTRTTLRKRSTHIEGEEVTVELGMKALPKKVAYMTDANEEEVAQVGGEKNVVRRVLLVELFELGPCFMSGFVSIVFVRAKTKLQVIGGGELFRGGRGGGECEAVRIITGGVVDNVFLG